jgi:hypothetical protein
MVVFSGGLGNAAKVSKNPAFPVLMRDHFAKGRRCEGLIDSIEVAGADRFLFLVLSRDVWPLRGCAAEVGVLTKR